MQRDVMMQASVTLLICSIMISGEVNALPANTINIICSYGLNEEQEETCRKYPQSTSALHDAVPLFRRECEYQFAGERWNCTGITPPLFGVGKDEPKRASKENAFIHALTSAMSVIAVTTACTEGRINGCTCDTRLNGQLTAEGYTWGRCSHNVDYGVRFSRDFLDARETEGIMNKTKKELGLPLANIHNNAVGRMTVQSNMRTVCRCHGMTGSCTMKTCWRELPHPRDISNLLKQQYNAAVRVSVVKTIGVPGLRTMAAATTAPQSTVLVFAKKSINPCLRNPNYTIGRQCVPRNYYTIEGNTSRTYEGEEVHTRLPVCEEVCCGERYALKSYIIGGNCNCHFVWCCEVICDICAELVENYYCL